MMMLTMMPTMGIGPILCICGLLPLLLLFSKTQTKTLMLNVNGPLRHWIYGSLTHRLSGVVPAMALVKLNPNIHTSHLICVQFTYYMLCVYRILCRLKLHLQICSLKLFIRQRIKTLVLLNRAKINT